MTSLIDFLAARLDEDEAEASRAAYTHLRDFPVERVRREVKAKRAILRLYRLDFNDDGTLGPFCGGYGEAYWDALCALAAVYSDHPDYDRAWRA
jgi:hypothetical protein